MENNSVFKRLGVFSQDQKIFLFYQHPDDKKHFFRLDSSIDGFQFFLATDKAEILKSAQRYARKTTRRQGPTVREKITACQEFRISKLTHYYFLTYKFKTKKKTSLCSAFGKDLIHWRKLGEIPTFGQAGMLVPDYQYQGKCVFYFGEKSINLAFSKDFETWQVLKKPVFQLSKNLKNEYSIKIANLIEDEKGIVLVYYLLKEKDTPADYSIRLLLFDKNNPTKHLWKADKILWEQTMEWTNLKVRPIGTAVLNDQLFSYWQVEDGRLFALSHPNFKSILEEPRPCASPILILEKFRQNPILKPIVDHFWESRAVLNPAVVSSSGKVHIVYRAVGDTATSVLGYASSSDGVNIDERLDQPIYTPSEPFEGVSKIPPKFCSLAFLSGGGGCGGCEDPRITKIGDKFYMIYVAYDGVSSPRLALTWISEDDFLAKRWNWQEPVLISRPGVIDKSGCLLPEKIRDKYVIFHRVFPDILIDFIDDLNFDGKTKWLKGEFSISPREGCWDSRKLGIGAPPIKTKEGWLAIYNGVDDRDDSKYQIGAMLLDLEDPTQVISRPTTSILAPTKGYEREGSKPGVVYSCGATVIDDKLFVYYGGSDEVICLATAPLGNFLENLKSIGSARLEPITRPVYNRLAKNPGF